MPEIKGRIKLSFPKGETIPPIRQNRTDSAKSALGRCIIKVRERTGLLNKEIAAALGKKLGVNIPEATLFTWKKGKTPRKFPVSQIIAALNEIDIELEGREGNTTWVTPEEVVRTLNIWLKDMTPKQIAVAANETRQLISEWNTGKHRVLRRRWEKIVADVESIRSLLVSSKKR